MFIWLDVVINIFPDYMNITVTLVKILQYAIMIKAMSSLNSSVDKWSLHLVVEE